MHFQNVDEINAYLLKDTTPLEYCKQIITDMLAEIREYLTGTNRCNNFSPLRFFGNRQCDVFLKNGIVAGFSIETPLDAVFMFDPEDIEYVHFFYTIPKMIAEDDAHQYYDDDEYKGIISFPFCCDLSEFMPQGTECGFDSIKGAFLRDEAYGKAVYENEYFKGNYRYPFRYDSDLSAYDANSTYFAGITDGYIGALVAEQILLSNRPEDCALQYEKQDYESIVADAPLPEESRAAIGDLAFMKEANEWRKTLFVKLKAELGDVADISLFFGNYSVLKANFPWNIESSASKAEIPAFAAVEAKDFSSRKSIAPCSERNVPMTMRKSRSACLYVKGTMKLSAKRQTSH